MILAMYTHLMSGIMLLTQVIAVGGMLLVPNWRTFIWQRVPAFVTSLVVIGLALLPLLPVVRHGDATGNWLPAPHLHDLYWIFQEITGGDKWYLCLTAASMLLGLLIIGLSIVRRTSHGQALLAMQVEQRPIDRKSTRLNSSHQIISYAVFCLKKKKTNTQTVALRTVRADLFRLSTSRFVEHTEASSGQYRAASPVS